MNTPPSALGKPRIVHLVRSEAQQCVKDHLVSAYSVVDIGSGIRPQQYIQPRVQLCIEPYLPYIHKMQHAIPTLANQSTCYVHLHSTWREALSLLPELSIDTVVCLDVIEHLHKEEGFELLREAERIARKQVLFFTPLGFVE